jgi:hypothetical protein
LAEALSFEVLRTLLKRPPFQVPIGLLRFSEGAYLGFSRAMGAAMIGTEQMTPPLDWQQLAQENGTLRAIVAELLIKNQNLRWELLSRGPAISSKVLVRL